jgi:serine/threonine-protein kinase
VIAQDPGSDERVPINSRVTIDVSKPPETVEVPGVRGRTEQEAIAILEADGFEADVRTVTADDPDNEGRVIRQSPGAGSEEEEGSTVTIFVGVADEPNPDDDNPNEEPPSG